VSKNRLPSPTKSVNVEIILDALDELSDVVYQQRVWISGSSTEVSSMNEAVAALFNDSGLDALLNRDLIAFSANIDGELKDLRTALSAMLNRQMHDETEKIVESDEWRLICKKAATLRTDITKIVADKLN